MLVSCGFFNLFLDIFLEQNILRPSKIPVEISVNFFNTPYISVKMQNRKNNTLNSVVVDIIKIYTSTNAKMDVVMAEYFASSNDPFRSGAEAIILQC